MYPKHYFRTIGQKERVFSAKSDMDKIITVDLDLELTNVGVLWTLSKQHEGETYFIKSGKPIVQVASYFDNQGKNEARVRDLIADRARIQRQLKKIDDELDALGEW